MKTYLAIYEDCGTKERKTIKAGDVGHAINKFWDFILYNNGTSSGVVLISLSPDFVYRKTRVNVHTA